MSSLVNEPAQPTANSLPQLSLLWTARCMGNWLRQTYTGSQRSPPDDGKVKALCTGVVEISTWAIFRLR